jgi:hypothetical protein
MDESRTRRSPGAPTPVAVARVSGWRLQLLAAGADLGCVAAFVWLPWASGRDVFAGRRFAGPQLARLVHNAGLLLGRAGPLADLLALALWAVPVAAVIGAVFALGARLTERPPTVLRWVAAFSLVPPAVALAVALLLAVGPEAGQFLARRPDAGLLLCAAAGLIGAIATRSAIEQ